MPAAELLEALNQCRINFDHPVLLTELFCDYEPITIAEVNKVLEEYVREEESRGRQFEKQFLVQGEDTERPRHRFVIAEGEKKLQKWLQKLKNAEHSLYSVRIDGGARAEPHEFKPIRAFAIKLKDVQERQLPTAMQTMAKANGTNVTEEKKFVVKRGMGLAETFALNSGASKSNKASASPSSRAEKATTTADNNKKKDEIKTEKASPPGGEEKFKSTVSSKKGIGNFFAPSSTKVEKKSKDEVQSASSVSSDRIKATPSKKEFFNKSSKKTSSPTALGVAPKEIKPEVKSEPNTSIQIFDDDEASSDEKEKLNALKREIITSDEKVEPQKSGTTTTKRRRILDSDDEDEEAPKQPQQKLEKKDVGGSGYGKTEMCSETFLDEDGFVITVKSKKVNKETKPSAEPSTSSVKKEEKKSPPEATTTKAVAKKKQANIMSFFNKKC